MGDHFAEQAASRARRQLIPCCNFPDRLVGPQPLPGPARHAVHRHRRHLVGAQNPARRHPRPLRRAGHPVHRIPRPGAAGGRGSGHLPADHRAALGAEIEGRARLLLLRRLLRLRHFRGRHRHLLGALAGAGVRQFGRPASCRKGVTPTLGPDATGVGWVYQYARAGQGQDAGRVAHLAGLVSALPAGQGAGRGRGGQHRRLRAAVPGDGRSGQAEGLRHSADARRRGDPQFQPRRRRPHAGDGRDRIHGARPRLSARQGRHREPGAQGAERHAGAHRRHRPRRTGGRRAARHDRTERRGRGGVRHRHGALRPECAGGDRQPQGQGRRDQRRACPRASASRPSTTAPN